MDMIVVINWIKKSGYLHGILHRLMSIVIDWPSRLDSKQEYAVNEKS